MQARVIADKFSESLGFSCILVCLVPHGSCRFMCRLNRHNCIKIRYNLNKIKIFIENSQIYWHTTAYE